MSYWAPQGTPAGWAVDSGYTDHERAQEAAQALAGYGHEVRLMLLDTVEHDRPSDAPGFSLAETRQSRRWCVLVKEAMR